MSHVDENDALYARIRAGDATAIDEMILANLTLAEKCVGSFLREWRRFKHVRDDLSGVAILTLTETVNSFKTKEVDKPTGFIVSRIDFSLSKYVDQEAGAGMMSDRTVNRRRSKGDSLPEQLPFDVAEPPARMWRNASGRIIRKDTEHDMANGEILDCEIPTSEFGKKTKGVSHTDAEQFISHFEQNGSTELLDTILACCESKQDETIIHLRMKGYTDAEIAEQLTLSRQKTNRLRNEIEKRFNEIG